MQPRIQQGPASQGLTAAVAAGLLAAVAALWAFRGLPLGILSLWLTPFPLFVAGWAFGPVPAIVAAALAALLVAVAGGGVPALVFLVLFAVPATLLLATAARSGLGPALAVLGLWPLAVLLAAAVLLPIEGGLEAAMRDTVESALVRMGLPAPELLVSEVARVKAAAIGFWAAVVLLANAAAARRFVARHGLGPLPAADWTMVRLPGWYPLLPAVAAGVFLSAPSGADAVPLSALLLLLVPLFLQGLAGVHRLARGHKGRVAILSVVYLLLVVFLQVVGPALVGFGLYEQFRRRAAPRPS